MNKQELREKLDELNISYSSSDDETALTALLNANQNAAPSFKGMQFTGEVYPIELDIPESEYMLECDETGTPVLSKSATGKDVYRFEPVGSETFGFSVSPKMGLTARLNVHFQKKGEMRKINSRWYNVSKLSITNNKLS